MISKSELESLAKKLMFEMNDDEYETLEKEFGLGDVYKRQVYNNEITFDDMKINVKDYEDNRVKVPKVVE